MTRLGAILTATIFLVGLVFNTVCWVYFKVCFHVAINIALLIVFVVFPMVIIYKSIEQEMDLAKKL